jgi:hypothetical protein
MDPAAQRPESKKTRWPYFLQGRAGFNCWKAHQVRRNSPMRFLVVIISERSSNYSSAKAKKIGFHFLHLITGKFHHGFGSTAILVSQMRVFKKHDARVKSSEIELAQNDIVKSFSINVQEINLLNVMTGE